MVSGHKRSGSAFDINKKTGAVVVFVETVPPFAPISHG